MNQTRGRNENWFFWAGAVFYTVLYALFYPPAIAIRDEGSYLAMAYALKQGRLFLENANVPMTIHTIFLGEKHWAPMYSLGMPLILLPFTFFGTKAVFLAGPVFHLAGAWMVGRLEKVFGLQSRLAACLYLLFPALVLYSRTLMGDIPAVFFWLCGCYYYFRTPSRPWAVGLFFGLSFLIRYSNIFLFIPFGIGYLLEAFRHQKVGKLLSFSGGFAPFFVFVLVLNWISFGAPLTTGYGLAATGIPHFGAQYFKSYFAHYFFSINLMYPLMGILFFLSLRLRKFEIWFCAFFLILFFSFNLFYDRFPGALATRVFGIRYLFPVIPFFILGYADFWERFWFKMPGFTRTACLFFILLVLGTGSWMISVKHQNRLQEQAQLSDTVYRVTPTDSILVYGPNAAELLDKGRGERVYLPGIDAVQLGSALKSRKEGQEAFLINWDIEYADTVIPGFPPGLKSELERVFNFTPVAEKGSFRIYRISEKEPEK